MPTENPDPAAPGSPGYGPPTSGPPGYGPPTSGPPGYGPPVSGSGLAEASVSAPPPFDFDAPLPPGRRIVPSPPPQRGRLVLPLVVGLVAALVFGAGGFFAGRSTAVTGAAPPAVTAAPAPSSASPFDRAQEAANRRVFPAALHGLAAPWLPHVGACARGGGAPVRGEAARVRCQYGDVGITFVQFASAADRDKARIANLGRQVDARQLTPGVAARREGPTPSGRMAGEYIEYAYTTKVGGTTQTVAALWWDDGGAPVAAYLVAYWRDDLGSSWEPLRDLWSRHA